MLSVVPCGTCDGPLTVQPGRGLVCPNGCDSVSVKESAARRRDPSTSSGQAVEPASGGLDRAAVQRGPAGDSPIASSKPAAAPAGPWEVFDVRWTKRGGSAVRMSKIGQLSIGGVLADLLGNTERVELRYDRAGQRVGIARTDAAHGAKAYRSAKGQQLRVSLAGLFGHYGLTLPTKSVALAASIEGGVLVIQVKGLGG